MQEITKQGMKKSRYLVVVGLVFLFMAMGITACRDKKPPVDETPQVDTTKVDTTEVDSAENVIEETPMPKAADELFDDFFFNFAANRKLQRERIQFPLQVVSGGKTTLMQPGQWQTDHFFMNQDFYTLIFDSQKQMEIVKDTTVGHVVVEKINLGRKSVKQYVFDRINGQWRMTSINNGGVYQNQNASFLNFYQKFVTDSTFQTESINDPLKFVGPDPETDQGNVDGILAPEQFATFGPELPTGEIYNIIYGQKYTKTDQKIFVIRGIANGLETQLTFKRVDGKWKLVKLII